jgi:hypothetical protein
MATTAEAQSGVQGSQNEVFAFSVVSSSPLDVVKVLCEFLDREGRAKCPPIQGVEKPCRWEETATIIIDSVPLQIRVRVMEEGETIIVTVNELSLNDIIRCRRIFNGLLKFAQDSGLAATCKHQSSHCFRLLDDDFLISDYDVSIESETPSWSEEVEVVLVDMGTRKTDLYEESLRTIASWSASNMESHQALAKGIAESRASISSLLHMEGLVETYPCWLRHCETW